MSENPLEQIPSAVRQDLDECCGAVLDLTAYLLGKNGEFFPVGTMLRQGQERAEVFSAWDDELGEQPDSLQVLEMMYAAAAAAEDMTAVAFAADVTLHGGGDAVRVELEHATGDTLEVIAPYTRSAEDGTVDYGQLVVGPGTPRL